MTRLCLIAAATAALMTAGCQSLSRTAYKPTDLPAEIPPLPAFQSREQLREVQAGLKRQLLDNPDDPVGNWFMAHVYHRQGMHYSAQRFYERALELAPTLHAARVGYARLLWERGEAGPALQETEFVIRRDAQNAEAFAVRGLVLRELGRNAEAIDCFESGWKCRPPSVECGYALAQWDLARGYLESAADRLRLCLIYDPNRADYRITYAETLAQMRRFPETVQQWELLASSGEGGARPYFELAKLYHLQGDHRAAQLRFDDGLRIDPNSEQIAQVSLLLQKDIQSPLTPTEFRPLAARETTQQLR